MSATTKIRADRLIRHARDNGGRVLQTAPTWRVELPGSVRRPGDPVHYGTVITDRVNGADRIGLIAVKKRDRQKGTVYVTGDLELIWETKP